MKTKFYEFLLPKEIEVPHIEVITNGYTRTIKCYNWDNDDQNCFYYDIKLGCNKVCPITGEILDQYKYFDKNDLYFIGGCIRARFLPQVFTVCEDENNKLQNHLTKMKEFCFSKYLTIIHRKHPTIDKIRQIALIEGKTDHPIHWID